MFTLTLPKSFYTHRMPISKDHTSELAHITTLPAISECYDSNDIATMDVENTVRSLEEGNVLTNDGSVGSNERSMNYNYNNIHEHSTGRQATVEVPMFIHEIHLLASSLLTNLNDLEIKARNAADLIVKACILKFQWNDVLLFINNAENGTPMLNNDVDLNIEDILDLFVEVDGKYVINDNQNIAPIMNTNTRNELLKILESNVTCLWTLYLVDVYVCPRSQQVSHTFQVSGSHSVYL